MDTHLPAPSLGESLLTVVIASAIISFGLLWFAGDVPVPVLLLVACLAPAGFALGRGWRWRDLEKGLIEGMALSLSALAILVTVGATIAAWAASGTIAAMIDLGLLILNPSLFLPAAMLMCAVISVAIGSSWATAATVGVALMGIAEALGVPLEMSAGAVLSGAYFGDKMSPLSDTTNLAPGIAGADLFEHIQAMVATTVPAATVALLGFALLGAFALGEGSGFDPATVATLRGALQSTQNLSWWCFLPPVLVVALALKRVPAIPVLVVSTVVAGLIALFAQEAALKTLLVALYSGHVADSPHPTVNALLSRGGIASMADTIMLVLCATAFGGLLERGGTIETLLGALMERVKTPRGLLASTGLSAIGVNFLIAEQYLAIVLPGRMFKPAFDRFGLRPVLLSRTLEDTGTVTSALCPWNSCGAFMAGTLGVATLSYLPFALFNLVMPAVALLYAAMGWFVLRQEPAKG